MLESKIESNTVKIAKLKGWLPIKLGYNGHPDRLFIKNDNVVFIEFKTEKGVVCKKQKKKFEEYASQGHPVYICRSVEGAIKVLDNAESI